LANETASSSSNRLHLSLLENAYDSFNESVSRADLADSDSRHWKHAVLHLVHSLELFLKQRLVDEHRLFLFENVDRPTKTVSLELALKRLVALDVALDADAVRAIESAIKWRNAITHYEVDLHTAEVRANYLLLFDFIDLFHQQHFGDEGITEHVHLENREIAARMLRSSKREMLQFDGTTMHRSWPAKLLAAQKTETVSVSGVEFNRIRWGQESIWPSMRADGYVPGERCRDCAAQIGKLHGPGCCVEECPRCGGQFTYCDCEFDDSVLWDLLNENAQGLSDETPSDGA